MFVGFGSADADACTGEGSFCNNEVECCDWLTELSTYSGEVLCYNSEKGAPLCEATRTRSEGWYYPSGELLKWDDCSLGDINCVSIYQPICGSDGRTYSNSCYLQFAGVGAACSGECPCVVRECYDSDGGLDYYTLGETTGPAYPNISEITTLIDHCFNNTHLNEGGCGEDGWTGWYFYNCLNGCEDGACVEASTCTDSDGGINYYRKGTVEKIVDGSWMEAIDSCISDPDPLWEEPYNLVEYTCKETNENINSIFYTCPNGCEDGACIEVVSNFSNCLDSDGGKNYYVKGQTSVGDILGVDACCENNRCDNYGEHPQLGEWYCENGEMEYLIYECPDGCKDGACLREATCYDSDIENDIYVKGYVDTGENRVFDRCGKDDGYNDENVLIQLFCNGSIPSLDYNYYCPNGCEDGVCIREEVLNFTCGNNDCEPGETVENCVEDCNKTCTPRYYCETSPIICPSDGVQIKRCEDVDCGKEDYEEEINCNPGVCSGCEFDEGCIPYGFRVQVKEDETGENAILNMYCDIDGRLKEQKITTRQGDWATCQNDFECESNICSSGECIELQKMLEDVSKFKSLGVKILCKLAHFFSEDNYSTCMFNFLGDESPQ